MLVSNPYLRLIPMRLSNRVSGVTVGAVVIPQGMAYAKLAALPVEFGLYSSFMGVLIYWFFATSKDITIGVSNTTFRSSADMYANIALARCGYVYASWNHRPQSSERDSGCPALYHRIRHGYHLWWDRLRHGSPPSRFHCRLYPSSCNFCLHDRISPQYLLRSG